MLRQPCKEAAEKEHNNMLYNAVMWGETHLGGGPIWETVQGCLLLFKNLKCLLLTQ